MTRFTRILCCACMLFAMFAPPVSATTTQLHPQAVFEGDITELVIEYDSKIASLYALDTAPLDADFEILDIKSRVFRIDGNPGGDHRMQWRLQLLPRHSGSLVIPPIHFGEQSTAPLRLEVKPVPDEVRNSQKVFVELDSEPRSPYVGQQTLVSLRLVHNTPLRLDGLAEPRLNDAAIYRDSEEQVYFVKRDGEEFRVFERQMLLFPRQAGELELPPAVMRGQLRQPNHADAGAGYENRKISRSSNPLRLRVREPPAAFSGRYWLPARDLTVTRKLQAHSKALRIGDSIGWTLTIDAKGLPAATLPANLLEFEAKNFNVYADQAKRSDRLVNGELVARLEQHFAIVVTASGAIELPALNLAWWDTTADSERQVRLAGSRLGIAAATPADTGRQANGIGESLLIPFTGNGGRWIWLLLALGGIVLVWTVVRALHRRFGETLDLLLRRWRISGLLKRACRENQAARARNLLIEWGRARWPGQPINGLYPIGERCPSARLTAELARLDAALFSTAGAAWRGDGLWAALAASRRDAAARRRQNRVPGLYPD